MKYKLVVGLLLVFLVWLPADIHAADLEVTCGGGSCLPDNPTPVFSPSEIWYPGKLLSKTLKIINSGSDTQTVGTKASNYSATGQLDQMLHLSIVDEGTKVVIWSGSLADFYQAGEVDLGTYSPLGSAEYRYTVSLPGEAGNEYQGKQTAFDLSLGFLGTAGPTSAPGSLASPASGGGVSAPTCHDPKPAAPADLVGVSGPGAGQVSLSWTVPPEPYTYFLVAYSDLPGWPPKWGNPNVGKAGNYLVSGLGAGTYYFWVRAGNGCLPGDFIGPAVVTLTAGATGPVAAGFAPGVLGTETESGQLGGGISTESGAVAGVVTRPGYPFRWWVFLPVLLALLSFFWWKRRR